MKDTLKLMKALSDEIRLRIINLLFHSDLYVCEVVDILKLPQSTVSRHLTVMRNANIVEDTKSGSWIKYSIVKNNSYRSIIRNIIEKELFEDEKCKRDVSNLKERLKDQRGCKGKC
ncbi:MAG: metalloregulator ArsR/SmtB family transcription factor [Clostridia bacterium]|nr:metalloregulator ArsR/SmtB family transcription factor [Clostridia bacterium]